MKRIVFVLCCFLCLCETSSFVAADTTMEVILSWDANTETDLAGYLLYYKEDAGGVPYCGIEAAQGQSPINIADPVATTFSVTLPKSKRWFFALTAYDTCGLESDYSNEVTTGYYYRLDPNATSCSSEGVIDHENGTITIASVLDTAPADPKSIFWSKGGISVLQGQQVTINCTASACSSAEEVPISLILIDEGGVPISKERVVFLSEISGLHSTVLTADETSANATLFVSCGHQRATYNFSEIEVTAGEEGKAVINLHLRSLEP